MKILYFARIRQIAGKSSEELDVPASVTTVALLIDHLSARDESVAAALAERDAACAERDAVLAAAAAVK